MTNDASWNKLKGQILGYLNADCPHKVSSIRYFLTVLEKDPKRRKALQKTGDRPTSMRQQAVHWFKDFLYKDETENGTLTQEGWKAASKRPRDGQQGKQDVKQDSPHAPRRPDATRDAPGIAAQPTMSKAGKQTNEGQNNNEEKRTPWDQLKVADISILVDEQGEPALPLDTTAPPERAHGYKLVTTDQARKITDNFLEAHRAPITLVMPPCGKADEETIKRGLEKRASRSDVLLVPELEKSNMVLRDPTKVTQMQMPVMLLHFDATTPLRPKHVVDQGHGMSRISMKIPDDVDVSVAIYKPMCEEANIGDWWERMAVLPFESLKKEMRKHALPASFLNAIKRPPPMSIRRDRNLWWRGENREDSKIRAIFTVPKSVAAEMMAKSGQSGTIIECASRQLREELKREWLPLEWTLMDALTKIAALPAEFRKLAKGIVPTAKGYAIRMEEKDRPALIRALLPEKADELGPALSMPKNTVWQISGLPKRVTKEELIRSVAQSTESWGGWTILPRRQIFDPRSTTSTWIVDAAAGPPDDCIYIHGGCALVTPFEAPQKVPKKLAAWTKLPEAVTVKGGRSHNLWADQADEDDMDYQVDYQDFQDIHEDVKADAQSAADNISMRSVPSQNPSAANYNWTAYPKSKATAGPQAKFRRVSQTGERTQPAEMPETNTTRDTKDVLIEQLQAELAQKMGQIQDMQKTINMLQETVSNMQSMLQQTMVQQQQIFSAVKELKPTGTESKQDSAI